ncbi:PAS domain S-box protein [Pseudobdellovibrio sp. HCB154]|uniref:PAS domain S-box protein n=1 Tax=Pseudobdellovibrio sp. HCB154 TaxID=3386277 RepID=UPI003916F65E
MTAAKSIKSNGFISKSFALLAIAIGFVSILGWIFDISILKAIIPNMVGIRFNAALCIFLLGISAYSYSWPSEKKIFFNKVFSIVVFVIAGLTFIEYLGDFNFGIDELVVEDKDTAYAIPGRMSFIATIVLSLTALSVFLREVAKAAIVSSGLQIINCFISLLALLGYLYGASGLLTVFEYISVSPQTILAFLLLNLSLLLSDKNSVFVIPFLSFESSAAIGRKFLFISTSVLIVLGFCVRQLTQYYNVDASIDGVVVVVLSLFFFSAFIWFTTKRLNRMEKNLEEKNEALKNLNQQLEQRVKDRTEELRKNEQKFRETIELAADGIFEANLDGVYTRVNQSGCRMLGYEEQELIGKTIMDIIPSEDIPKLKSELERHNQSGEIAQLEWNLRKKDGSVLPVEISARTVKENRIVAIVRDITTRKMADRALVISEKKFRTVFEGAYDGIMVADQAGRITLVNEQLAKKFGYQKEELIGQLVEVLIPERFKKDHVENRKRFVADAHARPMGAGLDLFGRKKDGTEFPVDISLSPVATEEGLRITAIVRDITERKKFEEQQKFLADMGKVLEEAFNYDEKIEKLAELLVTRIADACIIKVIEGDELVYKASATKDKSYSDEFKAIASKIVMPGAFGSLHVLKTGKPIIIEDVNREIIDNNHVDKISKDLIIEFGAFSYAVFPLVSQGRPVGTLVLSINRKGVKFSRADTHFLEIVSSRCAVALENARLQKQSRLAEVITNNLPSMIAYWDKNEICQFANRVYLDWFGVSSDKMIGKTMLGLLGPELYKKNKPYIKGALDGFTQNFERDLPLKTTGEIRHTNALYIPDFVNGEVAGFFVLVVDVTEIKQAQLEAFSQKERAESAVQVREEVLAIVSHDLKNPLAAVSLSADLLTRDLPLTPKMVKESGLRIQRSAKQMQMLISDLLDFAKMQSSTFSVDLAAENPQAIIEQVADSFKDLVNQKQISLSVNLPKNLKLIACDVRRIVQVLSNLVGNAVKFTPEGGRIVIAAKDENSQLLISVSDNGPGIPQEYLLRVFDRFWQAEKTKKLGSGLGLSIAKGIVSAHNGKIWAESEVGKGTTFFFTVPYWTEREIHKVESESAYTVPENSLVDTHILLVDDSEDTAGLVKMVLEKAGAEVTIAKSGREALTVIHKFQPDLVITDIEMADGNGFELLTEVRLAIGLNLPVISFSAYSSGEQYEKIKKAGFDGNIVKPIKPEELFQEVSRVLHINI